MTPTLYWKDGNVEMLDQSRLPTEVTYVTCADAATVARGIKELWVRGAPAIGVAAAMGMALGARPLAEGSGDDFARELAGVGDMLISQRPTAVNLEWAVRQVMGYVKTNCEKPVADLKKQLVDLSQRMLEEDIATCRAIGAAGAHLMPDSGGVLTHCNAGALATGGYGTALGVIRAAVEAGKSIQVYADETRPVLQGARLTAWELMQDDIDVTLICDNMAAHVMGLGRVRAVVVGADRIARNGDAANKIGTYGVAILAREHNIPFYVAAPLSTVDFSIASGAQIPIEERPGHEITRVFGQTQIAPEGVKVFNPAFDVTPARYIAAIITERGAVRPEDLHRLADPGVDVAPLLVR
ncbi:MAG: S-methyl-5-thioribose-1-phosphate isomerase [Nitrospirota bacterium]|nr:S-methyl-5-thioribose-1-phosphate isomerase [Nitrospirota bacterium]